MRKGRFIAFEGIDGSGKSTQAKLLAEKLIAAGNQTYLTFEPTDSPIGTMIRNIFRHQMEADHTTIAALFLADRLDHLQNKKNGLLLKLDEGYTVVCDRYYFSSYAYHGTHMSIDWVIEANSICADLLRPDLTIFIDVSPEVCMQRLNADRNQIELYETLGNLQQVHAKYMEAFEKVRDRENIIIIDGNRSPDAVQNDVWIHVSSVLNKANTLSQ